MNKINRLIKTVLSMIGFFGMVFCVPVRSDALTDLHVQSVEASDDLGLSAEFIVLLVDEDQFEPSFLTAIEQPFAGQ